ncbi:MAG: substrate-binding domain-containing protein [Thermoanaerobaculia bacterium]
MLRAGRLLLRRVNASGACRGGARLLPGPGALGVALLGTLLAAGAGACGAGGDGGARNALRVVGSTTVNPVVSRAAEILRAEGGRSIVVDTQGGSSGGIAALAEGRAEIAMSSRPVDEGDRRRYPEVDFRPVRMGLDGVALVVSRDVWEGGVRSLSREEMQGIYEGRIESWGELAGPERRIALFDKEPGRGTWEVFADWLYGGSGAAPLVSHLEVGSNEEARTKVASTPGGLTQLSAAWADGETVFALGVETAGGAAVRPTPEAVASGAYPMGRPLLVITDGEPSPAARELIELLLGPRGRELVREAGYLPPEGPVAGAGDGAAPGSTGPESPSAAGPPPAPASAGGSV